MPHVTEPVRGDEVLSHSFSLPNIDRVVDAGDPLVTARRTATAHQQFHAVSTARPLHFHSNALDLDSSIAHELTNAEVLRHPFGDESLCSTTVYDGFPTILHNGRVQV